MITITEEIIINADIQKVWSFLTDFERYRFEMEDCDVSPSLRVVEVLEEIIGGN